MKTTNLQKQNYYFYRRIEVKKVKPQVAQYTAEKDFGFLFLLVVVFGWLMRFFGAFIGRESIKIQKAPGEFISRYEEYQELETKLGPNTFFRMY